MYCIFSLYIVVILTSMNAMKTLHAQPLSSPAAKSLSSHHLQADIIPVHQLHTILKGVQLKLTKHPRLKLPLEPMGDKVWKFYDTIEVDCLIYENKIFTLMTIPLVEKDSVQCVQNTHFTSITPLL